MTNASHYPVVTELNSKGIINLIKNHEYFSGCCNIISERNLDGRAILNLSESQIMNWKIPRWLIRSLLSLREILSDRPHIFLRAEEDLFDKNDYLKPIQFDKPIQKASSGIQNFRFRELSSTLPSIPSTTSRKVTETSTEEDENTYEPPPSLPRQSISVSSKQQKFEDFHDEPPVLFPHRSKQPTGRSASPTIRRSQSEGKVHEDHERNTPIRKLSDKTTSHNTEESKTPLNLDTQSLKFALQKKQLIPNPLPPPIPKIIPGRITAGTAISDISKTITLAKNFQQSPSTKSTESASSVKDLSNRKTSWSRAMRPLPPTPRIVTEDPPKLHFSNTNDNVDTEEPEAEYENNSHRDASSETDDAPDYLNTEEIEKHPISKAKLVNTLKPKAPPQQPRTPTTNKIGVIKTTKSNFVAELKTITSTPETLRQITAEKIDSQQDGIASALKKELLKRSLKRGENKDISKENTTRSKSVLEAKSPITLPTQLPPRTQYLRKDVAKEPAHTYEEDLSDAEEEYDSIFNLNDEKFYRNTDRKGAKLLLQDLGDGAFVLRPSKKSFFLSITVKNNGKYFNLGIQKTSGQKIYCGEGTTRTPEFASIRAFLEYFETIPLVLQGDNGSEEVYLKRFLPFDRF